MSRQRHAITTPRLTLIAPTADDLHAAAKQPNQLASLLGCRTPEPDDQRYYKNKAAIYAAKAELLTAHPGEWLLCTAWQLCLDGVLIGEAGFKGPPFDARLYAAYFSGGYTDGEVEIGYALRKHHTGHGYMSEAVTALCQAAMQDSRVTRITAETKRGNKPSQNLLVRSGFQRTGWRNFHYLWARQANPS